MGLRSRQRRRAGLDDGIPFDLETSKEKQSLEDHLQASQQVVEDFNDSWKNAVGIAGLLAAGYELLLLYHCVTDPEHVPPYFVVCFLSKFVSIACVLSSREYVFSSAAPAFVRSLGFAACSLLLYVVLVVLSEMFTSTHVSPIAPIFFFGSWAAHHFIGDNAKAEVARAQELEALDPHAHSS